MYYNFHGLITIYCDQPLEYQNQNDVIDAYIEEAIINEEAYFPDDDDWDDDNEDENDDLFVDEDELISFMNEYFMITDKIPPAELF